MNKQPEIPTDQVRRLSGPEFIRMVLAQYNLLQAAIIGTSAKDMDAKDFILEEYGKSVDESKNKENDKSEQIPEEFLDSITELGADYNKLKKQNQNATPASYLVDLYRFSFDEETAELVQEVVSQVECLTAQIQELKVTGYE